MRVAVLTIPAVGHVNPTLDLVTELVRRGHTVTYLVPETFGWAARVTGADLRSYESTLVPTPRSAPPGPEFGCWLPFVLLAEAEHTLPALVPALRELAPDVLVYDRTTYLSAQVLVEVTGCAAVEFFPSFAYNEHFSLAGELERATVLNPVHHAYRKLADGFGRLAETWGSRPVRVEDVALARAERAIVAVPREFQPFGDTFPQGYTFTGPGLRRRGLTGHARTGGRAGRVYASLGTAFTDRARAFAAIAEAIGETGRPGLMVVGDLTRDLVPAATGRLRVRSWTDQLAALAVADVFFTHAGMGGVNESLALGVPMVCLPYTTEQQAIARRVGELGLGHVLDSTRPPRTSSRRWTGSTATRRSAPGSRSGPG